VRISSTYYVIFLYGMAAISTGSKMSFYPRRDHEIIDNTAALDFSKQYICICGFLGLLEWVRSAQ